MLAPEVRMIWNYWDHKGSKVSKRRSLLEWVMEDRVQSIQRVSPKMLLIINIGWKTLAKRTLQAGLIQELLSCQAWLCKLKAINFHQDQNQRFNHIHKAFRSFKILYLWMEAIWRVNKTIAVPLDRSEQTISRINKESKAPSISLVSVEVVSESYTLDRETSHHQAVVW